MWKRKGLRERVEMLKWPDLLSDFLLIIGLRYKTSLDVRNGFLVKFIPISLRLLMIGCLTLRRRREKALVHQPKNKLVGSIERGTMSIYIRLHTMLLVVVKGGTRLGISLM